MSIRPFVVEFTGTPEAGKTTSIKKIIPIVEKLLNCKIGFVQEAAELLPDTFKKGSYEANIWLGEKLLSLLKISFSDTSNNILIIDRGCVDKNFWNYQLYQEGIFFESEYLNLQEKFCQPDFLPNLCVILKTSPEESILRRGGEGQLVTVKWIEEYNSTLQDFLSKFQDIFTTIDWFTLDTTNISQSDVIEVVVDKIITAYNSYKDST